MVFLRDFPGRYLPLPPFPCLLFPTITLVSYIPPTLQLSARTAGSALTGPPIVVPTEYLYCCCALLPLKFYCLPLTVIPEIPVIEVLDELSTTLI